MSTQCNGSAARDARLRALARQRCKAQNITDEELQATAPDATVLRRLNDPQLSSAELLCEICEAYAHRVAFRVSPPHQADFTPVTYAEVWERTADIATGLAELGLATRGDFVSICGFSSLSWVLSDFAVCYFGGVSVPLPTNVQREDACQILVDSGASCLVCSSAELDRLAPALCSVTRLKALIIMDAPAAACADHLAASAHLLPGCRSATLEQVLQAGRAASARLPLVVPSNGEALVKLLYTSGSTGLPKGAMNTDSIWRQAGALPIGLRMLLTNFEDAEDELPAIGLQYMPLNHIAGHISLLKAFCRGGTTYFTRSPDMSTVFEDIAIARPTYLYLIPRISKMLADNFEEALAQQPRGEPHTAKAARQAAMEVFRMADMGGRVFAASAGSAPTAPELLDFLREMLQVPIPEGYGSTEVGWVTKDGNIMSNVIAWRLRDVPELGYLTSDKPYPRGELLVRTRCTVPGYFNHPKATRETFVDGFMQTGDVFEQRGPSNIVWIDRKSNIMKLSQGEFVSVSRLEADFSGASALIHQMYIHINSLLAYPLAVVVPCRELRAQYAGHPSSPQLKAALRMDITELARKQALQGYEIPRDFIVELTPFSRTNHLLTDAGKPVRGQLKSKYGPILEALYAALEDRQCQEALHAQATARSGGRSIAQQIALAAAAVLGLGEGEVGWSLSFRQLGGDSLAAARFAQRLEQLTGAAVPVSALLDHSHTLAAVAAQVEGLLNGASSAAATFSSVHGNGGGSVIHAADLKLAKCVRNIAELAAAATPAESLPKLPEAALVTGANGFLGRFLVLDLLRRGVHVTAIVRSTSDVAARVRLRDAFGDPELLAKFDELARSRLTVLAGDLSKPCLGLAPEVYQRLAHELDLVVHNGALVNHAFSYQHLFEPNVLGTGEVIKLAVTGRRKRLAYISSVSVWHALDRGGKGPVTEAEDGLKLRQSFPTGGGYGLGYACTKWAGEVLAREAADALGLPVTVHRCGLIMAHTTSLGQVNTTDLFTRLLAGVIHTGLAPASFYEDACSPHAHFDGIPVDVCAEAIAATACAQPPIPGHATYHVCNAYTGGDVVSLDTILGWVATAGYPVERIAPYELWLKRFKQALELLDARRRGVTPLQTLQLWERPVSADGVMYDNARLRAALQQLTQWQNVPRPSEEYIHKTLHDLQALGIIGPPTVRS